MSLGQYLRALRLHSPRGRIKMSEVVRDTNLSRQTVYKWEGPQSRPDPVHLRRYLQYLDANQEQIAEALRLRSLSIDEVAVQAAP